MPIDFFQLSAEVRNLIYEFALVNLTKSSSCHIPFVDQNTALPNTASARALLQANRRVRSEASPMFYYHNGCQVARWAGYEVSSFFRSPQEAESFFNHLVKYTRELQLQFPRVEISDEGDNVTPLQSDVEIIKIVQRHCVNVQALKFLCAGAGVRWAHDIVLPDGGWPDGARTEQALAAIHALLNFLPESLEIIVQFSYECLDGYVYAIMKKYGWKVINGKEGFVLTC
jgi:hypothetical protein